MERTTSSGAARRRARKHNKTNFFTAFFKDFGLWQLTGILMFACVITLIVGLVLASRLTLIIGTSVYLVAAALGIVQPVLVMRKSHKKSPEYKRAVVNLIIISVIFVIALAALLYLVFNGIYQ